MMYDEGTVAKLKSIFFVDLLKDNYESVCRSLCMLRQKTDKKVQVLPSMVKKEENNQI